MRAKKVNIPGTGRRQQGTGTKRRSCKCGQDLLLQWSTSESRQKEFAGSTTGDTPPLPRHVGCWEKQWSFDKGLIRDVLDCRNLPILMEMDGCDHEDSGVVELCVVGCRVVEEGKCLVPPGPSSLIYGSFSRS